MSSSEGNEEEELVQTDLYYTRLLQSLKRDEDKRASELERATVPLHLQHLSSKLRGEQEEKKKKKKCKDKSEKSSSLLTPAETLDPTSPYVFLKSIKFRLWNQQKAAAEASREQTRMIRAAREDNRLSFLCEREAKELNIIPNNGAKAKTVLRILECAEKKKTDKTIEKNLLNQYRKDPDNLERLLQRVRLKQRDMEQKSPLKQPKAKFENKTYEERLEEIKAKRETVILNSIEAQKLQSEERLFKSEVKQQSMAVNPLHARGRKWLVILFTLNRIHCFSELLHLARTQDVACWNAAKVIQRSWRRRLDRVKRSNESKLRTRFKKSDVHENRKAAVAVILDFLNNTTLRRMVKNYLRSIRKVQSDLRGVRAITESRLLLLQRFIETCIQPLGNHIQVVLAGRGLDLNNLSFFELTNLKNMINNRSPRVVREMHTGDFHAKLRLNAAKLVDYQREYSGYGRLWMDSRYAELRRELLKHFLFMKRQEFFQKTKLCKAVDLVLPEITLEEVQQFIKNERMDNDPLQIHLKKLQERIEHARSSKFKRTKFHKKTIQEAVKIPRLLLLSSINPEEILTLLLQFINIVRLHHTSDSLPQQHENSNGGLLEQDVKGNAQRGFNDTTVGGSNVSVKKALINSFRLARPEQSNSSHNSNSLSSGKPLTARPPSTPQRSIQSPNASRQRGIRSQRGIT